MTYSPDTSVLRGLSLERAECYGKPSIGARYLSENVNDYALEDGAVCAICGRTATNTHHQPAKGLCSSFTMATGYGRFVLLPSLIALCGSGTTGCHGMFHSGEASASWEWDDEDFARMWWEGELLKRVDLFPHSESLYSLGQWVFTVNGMRFVYREEQ